MEEVVKLGSQNSLPYIHNKTAMDKVKFLGIETNENSNLELKWT